MSTRIPKMKNREFATLGFSFLTGISMLCDESPPRPTNFRATWHSDICVYAAKETTSARDFNRTVAGHEPHPIRFDSHER